MSRKGCRERVYMLEYSKSGNMTPYSSVTGWPYDAATLSSG